MHTIPKLAAISLTALVAVFAATTVTQAQETVTPPAPMPAEQAPSEQAKQARERAKQLQEEAKKRVEAAKQRAEERSGKLADTKLRICKNRESNVNNLMDRITTRGEKQLELIDKIVERTQKYKTDKNLTVANYDTLLAAANAKKVAAQAAAEAVEAGKVAFKCDGTDPKGNAAVFKQLMQGQVEAIKAYRSSAIELLKAVKQSQASSPAPTPAPAPAPAPNTEEEN